MHSLNRNVPNGAPSLPSKKLNVGSARPMPLNNVLPPKRSGSDSNVSLLKQNNNVNNSCSRRPLKRVKNNLTANGAIAHNSECINKPGTSP